MKYETIIEQWKVQIILERFADGSPFYTRIWTFETEDEAINFAKEKDVEGQDVEIRVVEKICNWKNNA